MSYSSRSTSPDPITLPSSPLGHLATRTNNAAAAQRKSRTTTKSPTRRNTTTTTNNGQQYSSPSKSFIMDTGTAGDASPWRIKVTVEAEPKDGGSSSPSKKDRTKTTKIPLKGGGSSSSPVKGRNSAATAKRKEGEKVDGDGEESRVPQRKRKGTPIRRRSTRARAVVEEVAEDGNGNGIGNIGLAGPSDSPSKRPAAAKRRSAAPASVSASQPTERTKRLTQAREELDVALQAAVGKPSITTTTSPAVGGDYKDHDHDHDHDQENVNPADSTPAPPVPGDMTIAHDEDFTMVSVETLQSLKQNSSSLLLENSGLDGDVGVGVGVGETSVASVSYMPSSPPVGYRHEDGGDEDDHDYDEGGLGDGEGEGEAVLYPDVSRQVSGANSNSVLTPFHQPISGSKGVSARFDEMGWKPTAPTGSAQKQLSHHEGIEAIASQDHASGLKGATADQAIVIEDDAEAGADDSDNGPEEDDIWAEEASRSLEEEQHHHPQNPKQAAPTTSRSHSHSHSPQLADLFANEAPKPPRPKIPRTWRRSSGVEFNYVDSPEFGALRKVSGTSTGGEGEREGEEGVRSRRSSGVLTPPSTDDEYEERGERRRLEKSVVEEDDLELTQPDAAATQLQTYGPDEPPTERELEKEAALSPGSASDSSSSSSGPSPDAEREDSGLFWQTHLPNVYQKRERPRFQRQKRAMDLSELLNLNKSPSPAKKSANEGGDVGASVDAVGAPFVGPTRSGIVKRREDSVVGNEVNEKLVSSPLRKSLLKSSKVGGSSLSGTRSGEESAQRTRYSRSRVSTDEQDHASARPETTESSIMDSFESKASDQRQLLAEMSRASFGKNVPKDSNGEEYEAQVTRDALGCTSSLIEESIDEDLEVESHERIDDTGQYDDDPTRSYEERLNLDSPQKIQVNFNDSTTTSTSLASSVLAPKKEYPPLFGRQALSSSTQQKQPTLKSPPSITLVSKKTAAAVAPAEPGIFSRLSTTFWSAVVRPSGPAEISPTEQQPEPVYSHSLRLDIRSRYGVLSDQHPWTMSHMRTLHRLLNSCTSGKYDSIVPKSGPLPSALEKLIDKRLTSVIPSFRWTFTRQHAHVVDAFMQTLVPDHIAEAIKNGEMDFLGDSEAKKHRGLFGDRHGDMICFEGEKGVKEPKGLIQRDWVVKAVGNCVMANIDTEKRERIKAEEEEKRRLAIKAEREAWERKNGMNYEDDDEGSEEDSRFDDSVVLSKVRRVQQ